MKAYRYGTRAAHGLLGLLVLYQASCFTPAVWDAADPNEYVLVEDGRITEDQLKGRGLEYWKDEKTGQIYVEKSDIRKFGDYTIRTLATPVTVTLDAAGAAAVVVVVGGLHIGRSTWEEQRRWNRTPSWEVYSGEL